MNVVGVVILASPTRDPIRSKRHNGRCPQALHTYSTTTTPPPRSSKVQWSGRWDQQHDGVVLMVESIRGQGFAYAREVEEDSQKTSQTRARGYRQKRHSSGGRSNQSRDGRLLFIGGRPLPYRPVMQKSYVVCIDRSDRSTRLGPCSAAFLHARGWSA
jgi:hypothetical protein